MAKAHLLRQARYYVRDRAFVEIRIWHVPAPVRGSAHPYKYSLALIALEQCVLRYDNEAGKGDHRHLGDREEPFRFTDIDGLIAAFAADVEGWLNANS